MTTLNESSRAVMVGAEVERHRQFVRQSIGQSTGRRNPADAERLARLTENLGRLAAVHRAAIPAAHLAQILVRVAADAQDWLVALEEDAAR